MVSFFSAAVWLGADLGTGHRASHLFVDAWNCLVRLGFFLIVMRLLTELRQRLEFEKELAETDPLTGLANSRVFFARLNDEAARSNRYGRPFTLLYLDIDDFKAVNDTRGHDVGDEVLRVIAGAMRRGTRRSDTLARLGGDEFAALFPETDHPAGEAVIGKILACARAAAKETGLRLTFSIGAIVFDQPAGDDREMLRMVDTLMYKVKNGGKDNVALKNWPGDGYGGLTAAHV